MRVGLLTSEFKDENVASICQGADEAACKLGIELIIFPGKNIIADKNIDEERPYAYQYQAVFDYASEESFDGFIIDAERIGETAPILKTENFVRKFDPKKTIIFGKVSDYENVEKEDNESFEDLGFRAIQELAKHIGVKTAKIKKDATKEYSLEEMKNTLDKISFLSEAVIDYKIPEPFYVISLKLPKMGIKNIDIFVLSNVTERSIKKGWKVPDTCNKVYTLRDGKEQELDEKEQISVNKAFDSVDFRNTKVVRNVFQHKDQVGFIVMEYTRDFLSGVYDDLLVDILKFGGKLEYLIKSQSYLEEENADLNEQLEKDGSVLDHIGDKDYLTGLPNRRGFFTEAYDLLKEEFREGKYAVVAYIDMDSLKNINAIHGHDEGDKAVCRVAEILAEVFGEKSVCGRIRGDEFAVIQVTDEEDKSEGLRISMARQNNKLLMENTKYLNHLIYSICEFDFEESLSLREMLKETDENLKNMRRMESIGK